MRNSVIKKIEDYASKDNKVFLVTGDAGFGVLDNYQKAFKGRYLNLGIAEQNMISFAAGLSLSGYKVFVYNIIPFLLYRCFEQVRNDVCYQRLPMVLIGIGSGVTYAPGGVTHYAVEDIFLARTIPNLTILSPSDPIETVACMEFAYNSDHPVYIRISKSGERDIHQSDIEDITKPIIIKDGNKVAVLFHGSISAEVMRALECVQKSPLVISVPMLRPLDVLSLESMLKTHNISNMITVEEHFAEGGLGSIISEWIVTAKVPYKLEKLGITNEFIHAIKDSQGMREKYGISSKNIRSVIDMSFAPDKFFKRNRSTLKQI